MDTLEKIRRYENLHIVFWLVKDTCWMMEIKWLGALMILPTLAVALSIVIKTLKSTEVYISMAIFCWISANSFWMAMEFFFNNQFKHYSLIPFLLGFIFVGIFYSKTLFKKESKL